MNRDRMRLLLTPARNGRSMPLTRSNPSCGSGMFILDSKSRIKIFFPSWISDRESEIPDPTKTKKRTGEKFVVLLFCSHKFHKLKIILFLNS